MTIKEYRRMMVLMSTIIVILLLVVAGIIVFYRSKSVEVKTCPLPVCTKECNVESGPQPAPIVIVMDKHQDHQPSFTEVRDKNVIANPLYPPLNRSDKQTHESLVNNQVFNYKTDGMNDTYRLVGYLTNNDADRDVGGNNWKLFGRMRDRHTGDYYIVPSNNNYDIKIPLTPEVMNGIKLKDVYTLPTEMKFNSPMLNKSIYTFTEIPKTDFTDSRYT